MLIYINMFPATLVIWCKFLMCFFRVWLPSLLPPPISPGWIIYCPIGDICAHCISLVMYYWFLPIFEDQPKILIGIFPNPCTVLLKIWKWKTKLFTQREKVSNLHVSWTWCKNIQNPATNLDFLVFLSFRTKFKPRVPTSAPGMWKSITWYIPI